MKQLRNHDTLHAKAEEGNAICIMNKLDYINKTVNYLQENKFTKLKKDRTNKFKRIIKQMTVSLV